MSMKWKLHKVPQIAFAASEAEGQGISVFLGVFKTVLRSRLKGGGTICGGPIGGNGILAAEPC